MVRAIEDLSEFRKALKEAGDKLVVVDFTATWCGPCKMIAPIFKSLSEEYTDIVFLKVDVDEAQDVAQECGIKCMPSFYFFRNGEKIADFSGANQEKLKESILKYR